MGTERPQAASVGTERPQAASVSRARLAAGHSRRPPDATGAGGSVGLRRPQLQGHHSGTTASTAATSARPLTLPGGPPAAVASSTGQQHDHASADDSGAQAPHDCDGGAGGSHSTGVSTVAGAVDTSATRSLSAMLAVRPLQSEAIPESFPAGTWSTFEEAFDALNCWALDRSVANGGWSLIKSQVRGSNSKRGEQRQLLCHRHRKIRMPAGRRVSSGCDCGWRLKLEQTSSGWALYDANFEHAGHVPTRSLAESNAFASMRAVPADLLRVANGLALSHVQFPSIQRHIKRLARERDIEVTWIDRDLYDQLAPSAESKHLDATGLVAKLQERERAGLPYHITTDSQGALQNAFMWMKGAFDVWANETDDQSRPFGCIIFDTSHGTNRYGLRLGTISMASSSGSTKILALTLLAHETEEAFAWVFSAMASGLRRPPRDVYTDGDGAMARAMSVLPQSSHRLCSWHLSKTILRHIKPLFGSNNEAWRKANAMFWRICKQTDTRSRDTFQEEATEMKAYIAKECAGVPKLQHELEWLDDLFLKREKWAARWTWQSMSFGVHSTQRAEAMNAAMKRSLTASTLLTSLLESVDVYGDDRVAAAGREWYRFSHALASGESPPAVIEQLHRVLTPFAFRLQWDQVKEAGHYMSQRLVRTDGGTACYRVYRSRPAESPQVEDMVRNVDSGTGNEGADREASLLKCTCQFSDNVGLVCRHRLLLYIQLGQCVALDAIAFRWRVRTPLQRQTLLHGLLSRSSHSAVDNSHSPAETQSDRYDRLTSSYRAMAQVAAATPALTAQALEDAKVHLVRYQDELSRSSVSAAEGSTVVRLHRRGLGQATSARARRATQLLSGTGPRQESGTAGTGQVTRTQTECTSATTDTALVSGTGPPQESGTAGSGHAIRTQTGCTSAATALLSSTGPPHVSGTAGTGQVTRAQTGCTSTDTAELPQRRGNRSAAANSIIRGREGGDVIRDVDCGTTIVPATARQRRSGAVGDSSAIGEVGDGATPYIPNPPVPRSRGRKVRKRKRAFFEP